MSQNSVILPTTGDVTGLQMTQYTNNALDTLNTVNSGTSAPSVTEAGMLWHDTTNNLIKIRSLDNTTWIPFLMLNETLYAASPYSLETSDSGGFKNKLRNGNFVTWQAGSTNNISPGTFASTADGWYAGDPSDFVTWSQNTSAMPSYFNLRLTGFSGVTSTSLYQLTESLNSATFAGKTVTFQATIYNGSGADFTPTLSTAFPTTVDTWPGSTTDLPVTNVQPCPNGQTTTICYTFMASASAANGYQTLINFGSALAASGYILIGSCDLRVTPGLATGLNNNPPNPEFKPAALDLLDCSRYSVYSPLANGLLFQSYAGTSGTYVAGPVYFPVPMIFVPTITITGVGSYVNCSSAGVAGSATPQGFSLSVVTGATGDYSVSYVSYNATTGF